MMGANDSSKWAHCSLAARWGAALLSAVLALAMAPASRAEPRIEGPADAIRMQVRDASVQEAIEALGTRYHVRLHAQTPLERRISGDFAGPLPRVLSRLLDHYDYVVRSADGALDVVVLGKRGGQAVVRELANTRGAPGTGDFVPVAPAPTPPGAKRQLVSIDPPEAAAPRRPVGQLVSIDPADPAVPPVPPGRLVSLDPPASAAPPAGPVGPFDFEPPAAPSGSPRQGQR
jgi:hypothetical protein